MGIRSRMDCDNDIYSASVVERAISDWSLEDQRMGQLAYVMTYPERDQTLVGSEDVSRVQVPAKSASTKQSMVLFWQGRNIYPLLHVPFKYRTMHFTANS
jgi:hypothetical protein